MQHAVLDHCIMRIEKVGRFIYPIRKLVGTFKNTNREKNKFDTL